jgi:hypothetical protein
VLITGSYNESHKPRDSSNIVYERTTATDRPVFFSANNFGEDRLKHKRAGLGVRLDYRLTAAARIYFNTMVSQYVDQLNRRWTTIGLPASASNVRLVTNTVTETVNQTLTYNQYLRDRDIHTLNLQFGGESQIAGGRLDFTANYSPSKGTHKGFIPNRTVAGVGFRQDRSETHHALRLAQISGPDIYDLRNGLMSSVDNTDYTSRDRIAGAQLNFRKPLATAMPLAVKTGLRFRAQKREQDQNRRLFSYVGPNGVAGPAGVFQKNLRNFIFRSNVGLLEPGNDIGEGYNGYALTTDRNGGRAKIRGLEVSYNQQFSRLQVLGGALRGFGAFINFTWLRP